MKKLVLFTTLFIAGTANAGFLDGISNVLGKTGNVLNTLTGTPKTAQGTQNSSVSSPKGNFIRLPDKETSEYKFENMTIDVSDALGKHQAYLTGIFYNKTDNPTLRVMITIPSRNTQGFDDSFIQTTAIASAHGKNEVKVWTDYQYPDTKPDLSRMQYIRIKP